MEKNKIHLQDCIDGMKELNDDCADIIIADPPYNIGKDFGNDSDCMTMEEYHGWSASWITQASRILKPTGTMYIYGFPEILAHLSVLTEFYMPNVRWLQWHYKNKTVPGARFWQRSHESILVCCYNEKIFNRDDVRVPYTETFLKNAAGKERKGTKGRFGSKKGTIYKAHKKGALPRDVIEVSALAGGAGAKERWFYCKTCAEAYRNKELIKHKRHDTIQHPTQKPMKLTETLLKAAKPKDGGFVVVPFAGTGSELIVANNLNLDWIAFEINEDYLMLANSMIKKIKAGG